MRLSKSLEAAQSRLHQHIELNDRGVTTIPLSVFDLAIKAAANGIKKAQAFTLRSVIEASLTSTLQGLLHFYTSRLASLLHCRGLGIVTAKKKHSRKIPPKIPGRKKNMVKLLRKTFKPEKGNTPNTIRLPSLAGWQQLKTSVGVDRFSREVYCCLLTERAYP
jgi:hypothetical protein